MKPALSYAEERAVKGVLKQIEQGRTKGRVFRNDNLLLPFPLRLLHQDSMMNANSWTAHLQSVEGPMFHFVTDTTDLDTARRAGQSAKHQVLQIDARLVSSSNALMAALAEAFGFPAGFGHNWDGLLDFLQDLSWTKAPGYTLMIDNSDALEVLDITDIRKLIGILEETVRDWRDERGEYGERPGPVPFHVLLHDATRTRLIWRETMREPACHHSGPEVIQVDHLPGGVQRMEAFAEGRRLLELGIEPVLAMCRRRNMHMAQAAYLVAALTEASVPESRRLLASSPSWRDYDELAPFREGAKSALRELSEPDKDH